MLRCPRCDAPLPETGETCPNCQADVTWWTSRGGQVYGPYVLRTVQFCRRDARIVDGDHVKLGRNGPWREATEAFGGTAPSGVLPSATLPRTGLPGKSNSLLTARVVGGGLFVVLAALGIVGAMGITVFGRQHHIAQTLGLAGPPRKEPIPAGPEAYTQRDFVAMCLKWHRKMTVEMYDRIGRKNRAWDEAALQLLDMRTRVYSGTLDVPTGAAILQAAESLINADCDDPLVLDAVSWALRYNGKLAESEPFARRAVAGYEEVNYPKAIAWICPVELGNTCQALGGEKQGEVDEWLDLGVKWIAEATAEGSIAEGEQRAFWYRLGAYLLGTLESRAGQLYEAIAAQEGADPWIVNMVGGNYRRGQAWEARGSGWAYEVTEEGWKGFTENLAKAREHFTKAWELHPEYPEAPSYMIIVAMGGGAEPGETERLWFDRAVAAQLDYHVAYAQFLNSLLPRWGGSYEEMYDFGLECLATNRFDTIVPEQLYRAVWMIAEADCASEFWQEEGVYENLQTVFEGVLADPYRTSEPSRCLTLKMGRKYAVWTTRQVFRPAGMKSQYAAVAWRCGRYDDARRLFDELGEQVWPGALTIAFGVPLSMAKGEVIAATGPLGAQVRKADKLYQEGQVSEALSIFEQLVKDSKDDTASTYLRDRVATLRLEDALSLGEWIDLTPPTDLTGWYKRGGEWNVAGANTLELKPSGLHAALLVSNMRAPQGFEIRGKIEMLPTQSGAVGAIVVGYSRGGRPYYTTVELHEKTSKAHIGTNFSTNKDATVPLKGTNDFLVQVWDSNVTVYVNGVRAFADCKMESGYAAPPGNQIGFGGWSYSANDSVVRYRNCQIRQLTEKPSEPPPGAKMGGAGGQDVYLWYELENWESAEGWGHSNLWAPSGGRFLYPLPGADPVNISLRLSGGEWVVWVRARDETRGMRQGTATVNDKKSYILGGADSGQWIWYHVGFAEGPWLQLALAGLVRELNMDEWFDCLLLTNNLSFVPPGGYTSPEGYTAFNAEEDAEKGHRPAWIWWPTQPQPGTRGYYRNTFELEDMPIKAELSVGAIGRYVVYLNGQEVAKGSKIGELSDYEVTQFCQQGANVLAVEVEHAGFLPGLRIHLEAELPDGNQAKVVSDLTWKSTDAMVQGWLEQDFDDTSWQRPWARIGERDLVGY